MNGKMMIILFADKIGSLPCFGEDESSGILASLSGCSFKYLHFCRTLRFLGFFPI